MSSTRRRPSRPSPSTAAASSRKAAIGNCAKAARVCPGGATVATGPPTGAEGPRPCPPRAPPRTAAREPVACASCWIASPPLRCGIGNPLRMARKRPGRTTGIGQARTHRQAQIGAIQFHLRQKPRLAAKKMRASRQVNHQRLGRFLRHPRAETCPPSAAAHAGRPDRPPGFRPR